MCVNTKAFFKRLFSLFLSIVTIFSYIGLTGCTTVLTDPVTVSDFALNTFVSVSAYTTGGHSTSKLKRILEDALNLCDSYEQQFSRTIATSTLYKVNNHEITNINAELGELIQIGLNYSAKTNGAFDITIGSVSSLWDFTSSTPKLPLEDELNKALQYVDYTKVSLTKCNDGTYDISLPEGVIIDLGAIAKGYIADRIKDFLIENNISNAIINLGGNVLCVGGKDNNTGFNIALKDPFDTANNIKTLSFSDVSCVTSGSYERSFEYEGRLYHHILNPDTGYPYDNNLASVTIISDISVDGDCLSTVCFSLGLEKGLEFIDSLENVEAMFITNDKNIYYSDNFNKYIK